MTVAAAPAAAAAQDVLFVGNNWDGTADIVNPHNFKRIRRMNIVPDLDERMEEIRLSPDRLGYFLAIRELVGEGHDQSVDDMLGSHDGRFVYVSRPSLADVAAFDLRTRKMVWRTRGWQACGAKLRAMQVRAAVLEEFGAPLSVQELELEEPRAGEVLVRLEACGVCHTDMYTASGTDPSGYAPAVLGHEGAGVVEKTGEGVTLVAPGDHVVTLFSPQCGECVHCRSPKTNLCLAIREEQNKGHLPDGSTRFSRDGEPIRHFMGTSTFSEYTVMPEIALAKVDPEAPLDRAALFACGLSTGLGAAINTAKVEPGSTCVVFGAGMVGLAAVAGCRLQGAARIVAVDLSEDRLELSKGQGATDTLTGGPDTVDRVLEMTAGFGADYTFEATGNVKVMRQAVESARMGWGLCTVAGVAGKGETLDIVPRFLITGRRVAGSSFGGVKGRDQVPEFVRRYLEGKIDVDPFVSHHLTLDEVNRGFELMEAQDGIRSVIGFS